MKISLLLALVTTVSTVSAYHILCVLPLPSKSHHHLAKGVVDSILKAGHQVTWVTAFPDEKPKKNVKQIDVSPVLKLAEGINMADKNINQFTIVKEFARNISREVAEAPALRKALVETQFDAVISEWFFSDVEAGYAAVQQVPWILLSGIVMHTHMEYLVDTVRTVSTLPILMYEFGMPMNFWERILNTAGYLLQTADYWKDFSIQTENYESAFAPVAKARGITLPPFSEAHRNVSILLVNAHSSFAPAQAIPPNVVEIGGYHIPEDTAPLPKDLQDLLDASPQGVVYFSLGSVVKSSQLPEATKRQLIKYFGELPYTILWKFEEELAGLPKNVHIRPWMPQASILAHPNIKVFITHGGLLSTLESLHYGVPILATPVFGDQPTNAARAVKSGTALKVDFSPDMAPELMKALKELLSNDKYYNKAKYLSKLFRYRAVHPSRLIPHYVQLAIESQGAPHLRSKSNLYEWYQVWMLDQLAAALFVLYLIYFLIKKVARLCFGSSSHGNVKARNKKNK